MVEKPPGRTDLQPHFQKGEGSREFGEKWEGVREK
jgi:hypothetical protein